MQFQDYRQHDCQEFLALLLGTLHDQFNKAVQPNGATSSSVSLNSNCGSDSREVVTNQDTCESCPVESTCATDSPKSCEDSSSVSSSSSTASEADHTSAILRHQPLPPGVQPFLVPDPIGSQGGDGSSNEAMSVDQSNIIPIERLSSASNVSSSSCPTSSTKSRSRASSQSDCVTVKNCGQEKNEIYDRKRIASCDSLVDSTELTKSVDQVDQEPPSSTTDNFPLPDNSTTRFRSKKIAVEDFEKDMKIANSNLLIDQMTNNNKIMLDSSKFPKYRDNLRNSQGVVDNLRNPCVGTDDGDIVMSSDDAQVKNNSLKRVKNDHYINGTIMDITSSSTAVSLSPHQCSSSSKAGGDCMNHLKSTTKTNIYCKGSKKKKVEETSHGNNVSNGEIPMEVNHFEVGPQNVDHDDDSDIAWNEYLSKNRSVIVDTFQGQFKSTVRCFNCDHVSVTFEPFMYLPVPLPHALEKQVVVTFISCCSTTFGNQGSPPKQYLINVHKFDRLSKVVSELKKVLDTERNQEMMQLMNQAGSFDRELRMILAEVKSNHVVKILDDYLSVKFVDENSLFVFELFLSKSSPKSVSNSNPESSFVGPWMPDSNQMDSVVPDSMVTTSDANLIISDDSELEHLRPNLDHKSPTLSTA